MNYIWSFFAAVVGYIVFQLIFTFVDQNRKFEQNERKISGLQKENEDLRKAIASLLQGQTAFKKDLEKIKEEVKEKGTVVDNVRSLYEHNIDDLIRQGKTVKEENENLRKEIDRLQLQLEITKLKISTFTDSIKTKDGVSEDFKSGLRFFNEVLQNSLKEIEGLVNHVTIMDEEIGGLREDLKDISDDLYSLKKKMGHMHGEDPQNNQKKYSSGRIILNRIRSGVNFIVGRLVDYIFGGIASAVSLT